MCTSKLIVALFTIAKTWKPPKCPSTEKWIKKMWCIYNGILLCHKKNEIMLSAPAWMDPEIVILREVSDTERQISYDIINMYSLKKMIQMDLFTK